MFGSNFPVDKPATSYPDLWRSYCHIIAEFSADERIAMLRGNAVRTYRLGERTAG
jgi:L-fuconolactonase